VAPLGDPIEISLRGYELTLRKSEAQMISVVKVDSEEKK
ncbi:MAG: FeoA domain-containing protein, partial [Streptococcus gallolyticus]|nr:FeoA domain-containing protein [Streptococcus gallolyticus]